MSWPQHLLGIRDLTDTQIYAILDCAKGFVDISRRTIKKVPSLRGRTVLNVFYEASTRTRVSFELAAKRLSADAINVSASGSSAAKGESLLDTAATLDAMQSDALVLRHAHSGAAALIARHVRARVINAGDGAHEHPTQALLDLLTIRAHFGRLQGLVVAIVGDVLHSRVARSNLLALHKVGCEVRVTGPRTLLPPTLAAAYPCQVVHSVQDAVADADVVMTLRLQQERMRAGLLPSLREYAIEFGLSEAKLRPAKPQAIVMHPGPVNRGVEIDPALVDGGRSVVLHQVEHGVAVRAAILYLLLGTETT